MARHVPTWLVVGIVMNFTIPFITWALFGEYYHRVIAFVIIALRTWG